MKATLRLAATVGLIFFAFRAEAQEGFNVIVAGLSSGNSQIISSRLGPSVQITIADQSGTYSRSQAELILKTFFAHHAVTSFSLQHRGGSDSEFGIGTLVTRSGNFRTTFFLQNSNKGSLLRELRFEIQ